MEKEKEADEQQNCAVEGELKETKYQVLKIENRVSTLENEFELFKSLLKRNVLQPETCNNISDEESGVKLEDQGDPENIEITVKPEPVFLSDYNDETNTYFLQDSNYEDLKPDGEELMDIKRRSLRLRNNTKKYSDYYTNDDYFGEDDMANDDSGTISLTHGRLSEFESAKPSRHIGATEGLHKSNRKKLTSANTANRFLKKGRSKTCIWNHFNTKQRPGSKPNSVIAMCKKCKQRVSPQAYRLRNHLTKCISGKYSAIEYINTISGKSGNRGTETITSDNQIKSGELANRNASKSTEGIGTEESLELSTPKSKIKQKQNPEKSTSATVVNVTVETKNTNRIGKKADPVWEHYIKTKVQNEIYNIYSISTKCKYCGLKVSPQAKRLIKHLVRCHKTCYPKVDNCSTSELKNMIPAAIPETQVPPMAEQAI